MIDNNNDTNNESKTCDTNDSLLTDDFFTKDEIFAGFNEPFEVQATIQVLDQTTKKPILKRGKFLLRIPQGPETAALLKKAGSGKTEFNDEVAYRIIARPKFSMEEIIRLPGALKTKLIDIVNSRSGGLTLSDLNKQAAEDF